MVESYETLTNCFSIFSREIVINMASSFFDVPLYQKPQCVFVKTVKGELIRCEKEGSRYGKKSGRYCGFHERYLNYPDGKPDYLRVPRGAISKRYKWTKILEVDDDQWELRWRTKTPFPRSKSALEQAIFDAMQED